MWAKSMMGGGRWSPSTMMWKRSRMSCASSSLRRRMRSGAFHPVLRLRVYSTPCRVRLRV